MSKQIKDIMQSISQMSDDSIRERINTLRRTRAEKKPMSNKAKDRPAKKSSKKDTLVALLAALPEDERNKLLGIKKGDV